MSVASAVHYNLLTKMHNAQPLCLAARILFHGSVTLDG